MEIIFGGMDCPRLTLTDCHGLLISPEVQGKCYVTPKMPFLSQGVQIHFLLYTQKTAFRKYLYRPGK
jgi:hypothetical protein